MARTLSIRRPDDWHLHLRDGAMLAGVLPASRHFARAIVMPNLVPPVVTAADARAYRERILAALPEGQGFKPLMTLYLLLVRAVRPYINEIILLERNPLRARDPRAITVGRRASKLHGPASGELLGRFLACIPLSMILICSLVMALWYGQGIFFFDWKWDERMIFVGLPLAMWMAAAFMAVVRYLSYLDLRIRREGWAVELMLRAEASRLTKQWI